jgi:tRNA(Ile)-lysidine synthase
VIWDELQITATFVAPRQGDEAIDFDRLTPAVTTTGSPILWVKSPAEGDRFEPLGMDGKSMALSDFFRGRHVPLEDRRRVPLVCDKQGIFWVVGHRIAHRVRRTEQTQRTLTLATAPVSTCD